MKKISRNVSLNQRLAGISFAVFIPMILVMTYLLASLTNATSAYAQITKSVSYANMYARDFKERMDYSMYLAVIGKRDMEELGDGETTVNGILTVNPYKYIDELEETCDKLSYMATVDSNRNQIKRLKNSLKSLKGCVKELETAIDSGGAYEDKMNYLNENIYMLTSLIQEGIQEIFDDAQQKQENQIKAIRSFIQQGVDYIVVAPVVETGWETVLEEAKEAGIPVILSDRQMQLSDDSLYEAWVGGNFVKEGETCGDWLADYLEKQGRSDEEINMVTIQGTIGASAQVGRTEVMDNKLKEHSNWKMLDRQSGEFTQAKGQEVMESFLKSYDDIDVVICENDNEAFGAIDAIKAAGKTCGPEGDIIVVSFDSVKAAFESMIAGDLNATFECNPLHGPRVAEIIQKLEKGEEVEKIQYVDEAYFDTSMDLEEILKTRAY